MTEDNELEYPECLKHGLQISSKFVEMIYWQARGIKPITLENILFMLRHPIYVFQMMWFSAKLLGVLKIDHDELYKLYGMDRNEHDNRH